MKLRISKKIMISLLLVLTLCVVSGGLIHTLSDHNQINHIAKAADDDYDTEQAEDKDKKDKKDKDTKKSYASMLFDETDKNQSMMYFNDQTNASVPTVESTIGEEAGQQNGTEYAAYLNTLGKWNLYNTYTSQLDAGIGIIGKVIRFAVGVVILGSLYIMEGIDGLLQITAELVGYLNIFNYLVDDAGNIPKSNPLHFLQPLVDLYKEFNLLAKIFIAILLGWILFRVAILGTRVPKGRYLGRKLSKVLIAMLAISTVPLALSAFFGVFSDMVKSDDGYAKSTIDDVPSRYIVDNRSYIDKSLTTLKGKKNNASLNGGFVLLHDHPDMPKNHQDVNNKIPTKGLVNYLNTGNTSGADSPSGKTLVWKWMTGDTFTADDVDSMYSLSKDDKSGWWAMWENDEKRAFQFKLAYGPDSVKTFDGKDPFSLDLNGVSIQSASLAGNGPMGVVLNGIKMGTVVVGTTVVCVTLVLSIFAALIKSMGLIGSNLGLASIGSPQGLFGILATIIMLMVSWISALMILPLYSSITDQIDTLMTDGINNQFDMGGLGKQTISTAGVVFTQWFCAIFALKGRGALMNGIEDFFKSVIDRINSYAGIRPTGKNKGAEALNQMNNADRSGYQNNLDRMTAPISKSRDAVAGMPSAVMSRGSDLMNKANKSIKEATSEAGRTGIGKAKEAASNLKNRMTSDEEVNESDRQGSDIKDQFDKGFNAMSKNGVSDMNKNLDDQDKAVDKAQDNQQELDNAKQGLQDAKDHYNELKENGASKTDLMQAQDDIDKAQDRYDNALANSQSTARDMAGTGVSAESIAEGKKSTADDFKQANRDVANAKNDLESLREERQQMEEDNASAEELAGIDQDINQAEDRLATAQDRQALAKAAYGASIGNAQKEKDGRNDLVAARQAEREAQRNVESAETTGNLTPKEQDTVRRTAGAMSDSVNVLKDNAQKDLSKAETAKGALAYMANNHNQAFTGTDKEDYASFVDQAGSSVNDAKQQLAESKKNGATKSQISALSQRVMDANKLQAGAQTVMEAINSGRVSDQAITAQQQIVQTVAEELSQAQQEMVSLNQASGNGETISRGTFNRVQSNLNSASQRMNIANKALSSLHAMKAAGTNQLSGSQMDQAQQSVEQQIQDAQTQYTTLNDASNAINHVNTGGTITRDNLMKIVSGQKMVQKAAASTADGKREEFNRIGQRLSSLKSQLANGKPVGHEVQRMQNNYDRVEKELTKAENQDKAVRTSGQTFRKAGRTMISNLKSAQEELKEKQDVKATRENNYSELLKTGGYTKDQLSEFKKDIGNERDSLNSNGRNHVRERQNRLSNIKTTMDRAESIMKDNKN
ncbi:TPA: hypothetical protein ACHHIW_002704 [Staphylococcus aureus]